MSDQSVPEEVLVSYGFSPSVKITPIEGGLINRTLLIQTDKKKFILQWLNPIFSKEIHIDIEVITEHLQKQSLKTPLLIRTTQNKRYTQDSNGEIWRVLSFLSGKTFHTIETPDLAKSAGELVGRFHRAVDTLEHEFVFSRAGVHDTPKHLAYLAKALDDCKMHSQYQQVAPLAEKILQKAQEIEPLPKTRTRIVHGDLKISNILFENDSLAGKALLDLDTFGKMTIPVEMGDAFRSWCNLSREDASLADFNEEIFTRAIEGYALETKTLLSKDEIEALVLGAQTITLELASRFCADALHESYFGWNQEKFSSRSEHNQIRASSQLQLACNIEQKRNKLESIVFREFFDR